MVFELLIFWSVSGYAAETGVASRTAASNDVSSRVMRVPFRRWVGERRHRSTFARDDARTGASPFGGDARRRLADVEMGARGRPRDHPPRGDEGNARLAQVVYEGPALGAVRVHRDVEGVAMIEAHAVVERRLTVGAHRQGSAEAREEELLEPGRPR